MVCGALEYAFQQWYWLPESDAASKGSDLLLSPWDGRLSIMIDPTLVQLFYVRVSVLLTQVFMSVDDDRLILQSPPIGFHVRRR